MFQRNAHGFPSKGPPAPATVAPGCSASSALVVHAPREENGTLVVFYFGQQVGRGGHQAHRIDGGGLVWLLCISWKRAPDGDCEGDCDGDAEQLAHGGLPLGFSPELSN